MFTIDSLKFNEKGLIPAVLTHAETGKVLMVAYMNAESLAKTMETKLACFWSRSREELWTKGETSGNYMHVQSITADCDNDTLLVKVLPDGPACHEGTETCFNNVLFGEAEEPFAIDNLYELLKDRKVTMPEGSYTSYLFEKGTDKILKKVGEESTEVIIAACKEDKPETIYEIADLAYHVLVLMVEQGISLSEIRSELASRHVIDHKVKQEKMA